ncbi:ExbD/TolR family protein [Solilutibacter silvestris]|uniref:Biopolymer transport protein n=1 Tax=Solilutibacter silvestris TaxID=1645665 RepID=A0A2K1Q149_9GAMM|nr:biopolymer transporter ExbD [Lysobacter silvestris]PNS08766.1 Biopolymer transport protein [Lysobacter silvestris]
MAFSTGNSSGGPMAEINVTPLVDVMLVLLIIFMITTPLMNHKTKVELPRVTLAPTSHVDEKTAPVTLSVKDGGQLFLDDQLMSEGGLQDRLAVIAQRKPQPLLNIRADRDTKMQILKKMTAIATQAGMLNVGYVTIRPKPGDQK